MPSTTAGAAAPAVPAALTDDDLRVFLELSSEFLAVFDFDRGLVWGSPAAADVLGYQPDELVQVPVGRLVDPEDVERIGALVARLGRGSSGAHGESGPSGAGAATAAVGDSGVVTFETRFRHRDGGYRWLEWSGSVHRTGVLYGAARDVTERHEARAALETGEKLIQAIVDHSASAIFVKDLDERYVLVNEAFLRPLALRRDEVIGRTRFEIWGSATPADDHVDRQVMESGVSVTRDDVVPLADGPHTMLTVRFPLRDDAGQVVGMGAIATDITDRTDVEAALAERERLLDTIVRACPDIVTMLDRNGRVVEVSQASSRILGYDLAEPVHEELEALIHPDDLEDVYTQHAKLLTLETRQLDIRYRVRHKLGHWVTLDTRGQAIVDREGRPAGAMIVSRDITSDLAFEEELQAALDSAEQASTAKSAFLSRMSHELRTPLNSVLGFAQLLEMEELQGEQSEAVGHILRAGHHLLNLIDEVLDIARIESGRLDLVVDAVDLQQVVADAVDLTRPLADDRDVTMVVDLPLPDAGHVEADRQRLMQVLLNLLSNGVKYNRAGGSVTVSVRHGDGRTLVSVADTGPGI
ncbi:MAG TPA: PAS domain S-box protein, partial [Acidimicrobiales bacterium]|nr:PAS domain S-box protein [Acidimicrobiales bacterium]